MTSGTRPDSQEMVSPALIFYFFPPPIIFLKLGRTDGVCATPAFDTSVFFVAELYCWCWTFQTLPGSTLIRLAVSHSLEISYAVWVYTAVLFLSPPPPALLWVCSVWASVCKTSWTCLRPLAARADKIHQSTAPICYFNGKQHPLTRGCAHSDKQVQRT